jgi:hypothetical protein
MINRIINKIKDKASEISWPLLIFLLLVLNVKLVVKVFAILIITILNRKNISARGFFRQRYLFFYFAMVCIGLINLLLQYKSINSSYLVMAAIGLSFWMMCAVIAYNIYLIVQKETTAKIHTTVSVFFALHITVIFLNFLSIVFETGVINPYAYKGLNQKYYMSTGDYISGITFDAPVTTAFICAFGLLYFLFRKRFLLSLACMAALLIMASNFANLVLIAVFIFAFIFWSTRIQKSFMLIYSVMLIVFMVKISQKNNEHVGRIFYQIINKPYDLPPVKVFTIAELKKMPDSVLTFEEKRKKHAQNFIDSMNVIRLGADYKEPENILAEKVTLDTTPGIKDTGFYGFHETEEVKGKINRYTEFLNQMYTNKLQDSLNKLYNWKRPGKFIAAEQLINFYKQHNSKMILGNGIGNFSSRLAFKATLLSIAGKYPAKFKYINHDFFINHLYLYLYFHSQGQSSHEASNTPDTVYYQLAAEYGITALLLLIILYFGFFFTRVRKQSFGLPLLLLLAGSFFAEYWFEQFSIVVLFELLFFIDLKDKRREEQTV